MASFDQGMLGAAPIFEAQGGQGASEWNPRRFMYVVDDPSAQPYEGSRMLRWRWSQDKATASSLLESYKANPSPRSDMDIVVKCYEKLDLKTPYLFVLDVELTHFMPKKNAMRALHKLGLIEQD